MASINALGPDTIIQLWKDIRDFDDFSEDNDPYGEHDFGSVEIVGGQRVFWKIDYYADETGRAESENPSDPNKSYRVLTIMLASEY